MTEFNYLHAALFDELARQGISEVDVASLTRAVSSRFHMQSIDPLRLATVRCATGACDE